MKQLVKNYTINSVSKTITLTDFTTIILERLLLITDITNQSVLYQFNTTAGVTAATNVLTFTSLGVSGNSDKLQIYYDVAAGDPVYDSGENQVTGNIASGSADSGNPVKVGGVNHTTAPTFSDGQRGDLQLDSRGSAKVSLWGPNATTASNIGTSADAGTMTSALRVESINKVYNGTTEDLMREANTASNTTGTGLLGVGNLVYDGTNWQAQKQSGPVGTIATAGSFTEVSGTAGSLNADIMPSTDVSAFKGFNIQSTTSFSGTVTVQGSNDQTTWKTVQFFDMSSVQGGANNNFGGAGQWVGAITQRYMRVRMTSFASGTATGIVELYTYNPVQTVTGTVGIVGTGTLTVQSSSATGSAVPANAFYIAGANSSNQLQPFTSNFAADSFTNSTNLLQTYSWGGLYNGSTWDRQRNNINGVLVSAGTTSTQAASITTYNGSKFVAVIKITAGTGSVTVAFTGSTTSAYTYPILTSTALASGTTAMRIYPGATNVANLTQDDVIPRTLAFTATVSGTITYGIDYILSV